MTTDELLDDPVRLARLDALSLRAKAFGEILADRTKWGPGPWQLEPNRLEWTTAAGLPGLALRHEFGQWCAYVAVPPGHLAHAVDFARLRVCVHGGLSYGRMCQGEVCHLAEPGEPDNVYWIGFDCGHGADLRPALNAIYGLEGREVPAFLREPRCTYRTLEYVRGQVESLAAQLAGFAPADIEPEPVEPRDEPKQETS